MLFNSFEFLLFLPTVFLLYWFVFQKNLKIQNVLLLAVSYLFYGWWDWRFLSLIVISSVIDYIAGRDWYLNRYRESTIIICVGQGSWEEEAIEDTRSLDESFRDKGIGAWFDYWGHDVNHDWPWWYKQMNFFLGRLYG